jgi:hypothetical protein
LIKENKNHHGLIIGPIIKGKDRQPARVLPWRDVPFIYLLVDKAFT